VVDDRGAVLRPSRPVRHRYETPSTLIIPWNLTPWCGVWEGRKGRGAALSTHALFGKPLAMIAHTFQMPHRTAGSSRFFFWATAFRLQGQLWWPLMFWAMLASRKTGRPVDWHMTRAQMFNPCWSRRRRARFGARVHSRRPSHLTGIAHHGSLWRNLNSRRILNFDRGF